MKMTKHKKFKSWLGKDSGKRKEMTFRELLDNNKELKFKLKSFIILTNLISWIIGIIGGILLYYTLT